MIRFRDMSGRSDTPELQQSFEVFDTTKKSKLSKTDSY